MPRQFSEAFIEAHRKMYGRGENAPATKAKTEQPTIPGTRVLSFETPLPPSVNSVYGTAPNGQKFLLDDQKIYRSTVCDVVRLRMRKDPPFDGRLHVWMRLHFANKRRCDIDNRIKAALDALTHAHAYLDDSQIDRLTVERAVDPDGPEYCQVEIREVA